MLRTLSIILAIQTSSTTNLLIYYIRKLPLLNKLITTKLYANLRMKKYFAVFARLLLILIGFLLSFAYVGLMLYVPATGFGQELSSDGAFRQFVHQLFMLSFVVAGVSMAIILEPKRNKYVAVKLLRMPPARFMKATLCYKYVMYFIYLLPAMLVFGSLLNGSIIQLTLLTLCTAMWRVLCEVLHLKYYEKTGNILIRQNILIWPVIILGYILAYLPLSLQHTPITSAWLLHYSSVAIIILLGIYAIVKLARYPAYRSIVDAATKRDDPLLDLGQMISDANKTSVQSKGDDYSLERVGSDTFKGQKGHAYLNAIFFARHHSLIKRPMNIRLAVIGGIGLLTIIALSLIETLGDMIVTNMGLATSILALAMFYLSVGEKMCKAMFFHCDLSLLRYRFYRESTFAHFRIRLYKITGQNLAIAIALGAVLTIIYYVAGGHPFTANMIMIWVSIIMLSIFFSIHHLFLYYILQPYTTELNVKNPLFTVLTMIISFVCGISLFIQTPIPLYTAIVLILTVLYFTAALVLVRTYGSKTFRVK